MKNFIFIGDSLTFGYGINKNKSWIGKLTDTRFSKNENLKIINKGINGNTTTDMLNRFSEDVSVLSPSYVFIMGGTNDLLSNREVSLIISNIELMIKETLTITKDIYLGIPPSIIKEDAYKLFMPSLTYDYCEKTLPILRDELIRLSKIYNIYYIDFYTSTNNRKDIFIDGIHFNEVGHDLLYNLFLNEITGRI